MQCNGIGKRFSVCEDDIRINCDNNSDGVGPWPLPRFSVSGYLVPRSGDQVVSATGPLAILLLYMCYCILPSLSVELR